MKAKPTSRTSRRPGRAPTKPAKSQPKATTYRLEPRLQESLKELGKRTKKPVNRIVNEAVSKYLEVQVPPVEADLVESLHRLTAYRKSDPNFEAAIARFAEAEAEFGAGDPVEGKGVPAGPTQRLVRDLLDA